MATFLPFNKGILNPIGEPFERSLYGQKGLIDPLPEVLGSGIFGQTGGTGTGGCQFGYHKNRAGNCVPDAQVCPAGQKKNAAGVCVKDTQTCPTGQVRNAAGQCVTPDTSNGGCPPGKVKNSAGQCVTPDTGVDPCPDPNHVRNAAGVCVPKGGTGPESGCPQGWSRDQWGICRPPEKKDVTTLCEEGEIWSGGKCHPTGQSCPDPTTHWDAFTGRCLPNEQDLTTCRWGRNPHTDQCNPNPNRTLTTADIGTVRTTPTGGILTDTGLNTGDYRLDYSPYGAEDRGQDERSRILAGILDGGTTPYSPILSPEQELAAANRQAAIDFETAPGLLAAIKEEQKVSANKANDAVKAAEKAQNKANKPNASKADKKAANDAKKAADKAIADAEKKADNAAIKAAAEASRKAEDDRAAAVAAEAERQRQASAAAMAQHWKWMEENERQRAADEQARIAQMGFDQSAGACPAGQSRDAFGNCISTANIWS